MLIVYALAGERRGSVRWSTAARAAEVVSGTGARSLSTAKGSSLSFHWFNRITLETGQAIHC